MSLNKTRRRGAELEDAILDAAWEQLREGGYPRFTIEAVAERAGTSRPVLYRRWPSRGELLVATIRHIGDRTTIEVPDTGNLRDDLYALLGDVNQARGGLIALISAHLGSYFDESGSTPADLREQFLAGRPGSMRTILERAAARGEVPADLPQRVQTVPFDLFRGEALLTLQPIGQESIRQIIDEVFLPLIAAYQAKADHPKA
ncbi:TetR/AcrR family transcriptional regulator [Actinoplanes sp. NPDC026623]|uniref:TetR/AcrR family transcriptional regulator n=1 Tax=Actinoplanes sp. NPDC026623 TaxID=3155610 RepID=UPI00340348BB